jgi:hypothetical protein
VPNCPKCGYLNPETARYCQSCASPIISRRTPSGSPATPTPRKSLTYGQKWAVGGGILVIIVIIVGVGASMSASPYRAAFTPPNMKISVISNICWSGSVGGTGSSSTKDGCGSDSWSFPNEKIVSAVVQLKNKCSFDPYTYQETCETGSLQVTASHTDGRVCNQSSTSARYGLADVTCSE